jgi:hypothetical protein
LIHILEPAVDHAHILLLLSVRAGKVFGCEEHHERWSPWDAIVGCGVDPEDYELIIVLGKVFVEVDRDVFAWIIVDVEACLVQGVLDRLIECLVGPLGA